MIEFYINLVILEGLVLSNVVNGVDIVFHSARLGQFLNILVDSLDEYVWKKDDNIVSKFFFIQRRVKTKASKVLKREMKSFY